MSDMFVISGSSNPQLAIEIAQLMGLESVPVEIGVFPNGEKRIHIQKDVHGQNIVLVQSFSSPADEYIMEFLLLVDALERMGARHINAVIPWMGYSLQDKVFNNGQPLSAKVVADLVSQSYIKRVLLLDLHNQSIPGFYSVPTRQLSALELFAEHIKKTFDHEKLVIASPDFGGLKRAREFAKKLDLDLVNIDKQRDLRTGQVTATSVHGDVANKIVVLFDDCIVGGGTVVETAKLLKDQGAKSVHFLATHGIFVNESQNKIQQSEVDSVLVTNSIQHPTLVPKITELSVASLFVDSLKQWL
ncbi:ribose-phosphate pyrophosphokinase [Candidatus Woesebacteria bacterium]|nr:ribose-phosphate pyrophosphokinase [Candidatus Woesebacteria bacterium]